MTLALSKLRDQAEIIMGQSPPGDSYNAEGVGVPLLNGPTEFGPVHPTEQQWTTAPTKLCNAGDVLFCVRGATAGRTNIADKQYCLGRGLAAVRAKPDRLEGRFLHYVLAAGYARFQSKGVGSTFINISAQMLSNFDVPLMPLDEQRRVASILDQADDLRRKRREALEKAAALPSMLFLEMFGDWSRPGFNGRLVQLGEKLDFLTSGSRGWAEYYRDTGSLFLRIQNVKHDDLDLSEVAYVDPPNTAEAERTRVQPGDVLLSITADLGRTAVIPDGIGEAFINQHLSILRSSKIEPRYLSAAISSRAGQLAVRSKNREGVKAGLNFEDVRSLNIPDADIGLQRKFATRASEMDKLKASQRLHLAKLDELFGSLQYRAFHGEL
jgi:type I restriction enzyme S subunit